MISLRPFHPHLLVVAIVAATSLLFAAGCSRGGPKTLPVVGQVKISGVDSSVLAGHTLEIALDTNRQVRAAGEIQSDGSFELQTIQQGAVLTGALPGVYQARLVLSDDDIARKNLAAKSIHPRHLQFEQSGLTLHVPSDQPVALEIKRR